MERKSGGDREKAEELIKRLGQNLGLFLLFYDVDNNVPGKSRDHYLWFRDIAMEVGRLGDMGVPEIVL